MSAQRRIWAFQGLVLGLALVGAASSVRADEPMAMAGTWRWKWTDGEGVVHHHVLEVEGKGKTLSARERFDEEKPVKITDLKIDGKAVTFSVLRGAHRAEYKGKFKSADHIDGTVGVSEAEEPVEEYGWSADREETTDSAPKSSKP